MSFVFTKSDDYDYDDDDYTSFTLTYKDENQKITFSCDCKDIDKSEWINLVNNMNNNSAYDLLFDTVNGSLSISSSLS